MKLNKMSAIFGVFTVCIMTMLLFINSSLAGGLEPVMSFLDSAKQYMADHAASISSVGIVLFGIIKAVSNEKAELASNKILKGIAFLQAGWDCIPKILMVIGELLLGISNILAKILKSDGFGGAK